MVASRHIRRLSVAAIALSALAWSGSAWGKCGPGSTSGVSAAVQQYVEQIPTSCGSKVTGAGKGSAPLPPFAARQLRLRGGSQAKLLRQIATSRRFGAPQAVHASGKAGGRAGKAGGQAGKAGRPGATRGGLVARERNPLAASVSVVTSGSDARLIALIVLMVGIAICLVAAAMYRRRVTR